MLSAMRSSSDELKEWVCENAVRTGWKSSHLLPFANACTGSGKALCIGLPNCQTLPSYHSFSDRSMQWSVHTAHFASRHLEVTVSY